MGHIDKFETYQTLNSDNGVALCLGTQRDPNNYTTQYPMLKAKAGDSLVANYTENGHITVDKLPPDNKAHPGNYSWVCCNCLQNFDTHGQRANWL
jgi:hypothetical protein